MFHLEIRQATQVARAFNLSEADLHARFLAPLAAGQPFEFQDKEWVPRRVQLTVIEGEHLAPGQLTIGQGWTNAVKRGEDVTQRFLGAARPPAAGGGVGVGGRGAGAGVGGRGVGVAGGGGGVGGSVAGVGLDVAGRLRERVLGRLAAGPLPLDQALALSDDLMAGARVSERLGAVETVVWELLHTSAGRGLVSAGVELPKERWEATILDAATWLGGGDEVALV